MNKFNKIKDIINLVLAMFITLTPIITVLLTIIGTEVKIHQLFQTFGVLYLIFLPVIIIYFCLQKGFWQTVLEKLKTLPIILTLALYGWMLISCMVTNTFNIFFFYFIIYLLIFICIITLDKKYENLIVNTLIITLAFCCFLGILDPGNKFMPGFDIGLNPLSLMFYNPNYSGYAMAMIAILNIWIMTTTDNKKQRIMSIVSYVLFAIFLFMNGSFAPITGLFFTLIVFIIYLWIKKKKCPTKLIWSFVGLIPFIFLVDLFPDINDYRTCDYNYFLECIAVLDNILGTKMLRMFGISSIAGSDGWGRSNLQAEAMKEILSSFSIFLFGKGSGGNFYFIPHNTVLCLWLNYGIIATILYYALNIYLIVKFFKLKNPDSCIGYVASVIGYLIMMMTGDLIEYSFCFHMIVFAIAFRKVENQHKKEKLQEQEEHIRKYMEEQEKIKELNKSKKGSRKSSNSSTKTSNTTKSKTTKKVEIKDDLNTNEQPNEN